MCSSASRARAHTLTPQPLADPPDSITRLPKLLQSCVSSMLACEYSVFKARPAPSPLHLCGICIHAYSRCVIL